MSDASPAPRRSRLAAMLVGIGLMAGVDEIVFHQVLAWHHFYDRATPWVGLLSDGLLHAAELIFLVAGYFLLGALRRDRALALRHAWGGFFIGMGGFQVFDGLVNHKLLRLHQIRYVDNVLPYDLAWNAAGLVLIGIGIVLALGARGAGGDTPGRPRRPWRT